MNGRNRNIQNSNASFFSGSQKGNSFKAVVSNGNSLYLGTENGNNWFNVLQYGAMGDGVSNDTSAIQSVISNAPNGSVVYFPAGTYLVNAITLKPSISIKGSGEFVTTIIPIADSITIFSYTNPTVSTTQSYFSIEDIGFDANGKSSCYGLILDGVDATKRLSNIRIEGTMFTGAFAQAIKIRYCANSFITSVFISSSTIGIEVNNCTDTNLENCMAQSGGSTGYYIVGGASGAFDEGVRLINCSTNGQGQGLYIDGQDWGIAIGCSFTSCPLGSLIVIGTSAFWKFNGCEFATGVVPNAGISLSSGTTGYQFIGNTIGANTFGAIVRGSKHVFSGNYMITNSNTDIFLDGATGCSISSNIINSPATYNIYEVSPANYNIVLGNIRNNAMYIIGANTIQANNLMY